MKRNEDRNDRMIKDLKQEIERLKQQVGWLITATTRNDINILMTPPYYIVI